MNYIMISLIIILPIIFFIIGYKIGTKRDDPVGWLLTAEDPDDGVYFFMELETEPKYILQKREITLRVGKNNNSYNGN